MKIGGMWDKAKCIIGWSLGGMIFIGISLMSGDVVEDGFMEMREFEGESYGILGIVLFVMLSVRLILEEIEDCCY